MDIGKDCEFNFFFIVFSVTPARRAYILNKYPTLFSYLYPDGRNVNPDLSVCTKINVQSYETLIDMQMINLNHLARHLSFLREVWLG